MQKLFTVNQIKEIEKKAIKEQFNGNDFALMQLAGLAAFNKMQQLYGDIKHFIIFCGQGNNGGDGFVIAKLAAEQHYNVTVVFLGQQHKLSKASTNAYNAYLAYVNHHNIKLVSYEEFKQQAIEIEIENNKNVLYIDALIGTGLNKEPEGLYKLAINYLNNLNAGVNYNKAIIFSIDVPSGLQADTGFAYSPTIKASATITYIEFKQGLFTANGPDYCGQLFLDDLSIVKNIYDEVNNDAWLINKNWAEEYIELYFPKRRRNSHKHQFGHVVIIGGDYSMPGAVVMAGQSALRAGAGLVTIITHNDHSSGLIQYQPEFMVYGVSNNFEIHQEELLLLLEKASVILLGPGLGQSVWSRYLFNLWLNFIIKKPKITTVIDADGLNLLSEISDDAKYKELFLKLNETRLVLTPHPGEAKKLLHNKIDVGLDRFAAVKLISLYYNSVTILKGVGSLVYERHNKIGLCNLGNPGLASAGTGDILAGLVSGLISQKLDEYDACCLAVYLHGMSADLQAQRYGERGLLATDLLLEIRKLLNNI